MMCEILEVSYNIYIDVPRHCGQHSARYKNAAHTNHRLRIHGVHWSHL